MTFPLACAEIILIMTSRFAKISVQNLCLSTLALLTTACGKSTPVTDFSYKSFAYVTSKADGTVTPYSVNPSTGALTAGTAVAAGSGPTMSAIDANSFALFTLNETGKSVSTFLLNSSNGALTPTGTGSGDLGGTPIFLAADPQALSNDNRAFSVAMSGGVQCYTFNPTTHAVASVGNLTVASPKAIAYTPNGKFAFVSSSGGNVFAFTVDATTGLFTQVGSGVAAGAAPGMVLVEPMGTYAYVLDQTGNKVYAYSINATTGALTALAGSPFGTTLNSPNAITYDPSGRFIYVSNGGNATISSLLLNSNTGYLTGIGTTAVGAAPAGVAYDGSGSFVFVANSAGNSLSTLTVDITTGAGTIASTLTRINQPLSILAARFLQ